MTQQTIDSMPGGIKRLLNDLIGLAEFLKAYETVESFDQTRREVEAALATQQQILFEAKQNAVVFINDAKNQAAIEVAKIEAETATLRTAFDNLNANYQAQVNAKAQLDSDVSVAQAKLDGIKGELARITSSLQG